MRRFLLAGLTATAAVTGCSNDYDAFQFEGDETGGSSGSTSGGTAGASAGGTGGVVTGGGGTGGAVAIPGCDDTYGQLDGVDEVCMQTDATCELAFAATTQTCREICQQGGGVCQAVYNNQPGACGHGQQADCNDSTFNDAVCICSRGCGSGPPCPGNQVCNPGGNCGG